MKKIFLAPRSGEQSADNFQKTIEGGYKKDDILVYLKDEDKIALRGHDTLFIWGNRSGGQGAWKKMEKGDYVFFYQHGKITYVGELLYRCHNKELADKLWGPYIEGGNKEYWEYLYFVENIKKVDIDYSVLTNLAGYKSNAKVYGFQSYRDEGVQKINERYGSIDNFVNQNLLGGGLMPKIDLPRVNLRLDTVISAISDKGFVFEPWQIAAYIAALRTKPFVILAGVSGTGKSKLPELVADATGGKAELIPVRPDWTDSSDVLGYCDLQGNFRPGRLLEIIKEAWANNDKHYVCIIDEMNLARVEHYFAEVLSRIEDRREVEGGGFKSGPLVSQKLSENDAEWAKYGLPPNLAIVGTVNMDESSHGFSRKVLDRSFTIELSEINLENWGEGKILEDKIIHWPITDWFPRATQLGMLKNYSANERDKIQVIITKLKEINSILIHAQLQIGYRTRDEIVMFVLHAQDYISSFKTRDDAVVDPLDLALQMKILPRIVGGSSPVRRVVYELLGWASNSQHYHDEEEAQPLLDNWDKEGRPSRMTNTNSPFTVARLCLMLDRIKNEGFTSFWL